MVRAGAELAELPLPTALAVEVLGLMARQLAAPRGTFSRLASDFDDQFHARPRSSAKPNIRFMF